MVVPFQTKASEMSIQPNSVKRFIAYFSMEIALENAMPSYSGGLGVLAGDTIRAAADLRLPMVAVSLLYRKGYFTQRLAEDGQQTEEPVEWRAEDFLTEEPARASVPIENRRLELRCWRYSAKGVHGFEIPVYFLDADLPSNTEFDRNLTGSLYGGDSYYRLCQEVVLGIGGVRMLRALGYSDLTRFHMNEGHAALLSLELLGEEAQKAGRTSIRGEDIQRVRGKCVFTTHTPVPAGHDRFPMEYLTRVFPEQINFFDLNDASAADLVKRILQAEQNVSGLQEAARQGATVNMTQLALNLSTYINGVAKQHGETSRQMFPGMPIHAITNGVHAGTWTCPAFQQLLTATFRRGARTISVCAARSVCPRRMSGRRILSLNTNYSTWFARKPACSLTPKCLPLASRAAPQDTRELTSSCPTSTVCARLPKTRDNSRLSLPEKPILMMREAKTSFVAFTRRRKRCGKTLRRCF